MAGNSGQFKKGDAKPSNSGRRKGGTNKLTVAAKEAFQLAFQGLGGVDGLMEWARGNPDDFYKLYARLIPVDVQHGGSVKFEGLQAVYTNPDQLQPSAEARAVRH